jgi:hypothetical protein
MSVFVYRLAEPIDEFDGLTPLPEWRRRASAAGGRWALQAVLALADASCEIGWRGDMRHLPSVGVVPTPPEVRPYLVVKQDNNGVTFVITTADSGWLGDAAAASAQVATRPIGAWTHPLRDDIPQPEEVPGATVNVSGCPDGPAF